jgi:TonB family protein
VPVSVGDFDQLTQAISEIRFFDLPDVIGLVVEDAEQVVVTVTTTQNMKTVTTFDLAAIPLSTVVALGDALAAKLPWEKLNQLRDGILNPFPLRKVEPRYTEQARKARLQGSVIVRVEVRPDGTVAPDNITVVQGLGTELDENAIEAVKQWIFKPAYKDGKPIGTPMPVNAISSKS